MTVVSVATEDELSEAVAIRLLGEHRHVTIGQCLRRDGAGYLRSRAANWCQLAEHQALLLLTDLDAAVCPSQLLSSWFGARRRPAGLMVRIAVREVEAWLLADHDAVRSFLARPQLRVPDHPETLADPKQTLIDLAKRGPRPVRDALLPAPGSMASKGIGYNHGLINTFLPQWQPAAAAARSPSLQRARLRIAEFCGS